MLKFEGGKTSLSMKEVDQETGEDLNPKDTSSLLDVIDAPRNPEAPWLNPSTSSNPDDTFIGQKKRFAYFLYISSV